MSVSTSVRTLPAQPNLAQYKKQAKDLLHAFESSDPEAHERVSQFHPRYRAILSSGLTLNDAQIVIAREHGEKTWAAFRAVISSTNSTFEFAKDKLIEWILNGQVKKAISLIGQGKEVAAADIYTASITGNYQAVQSFIDANATIVNKAGGIQNRPPLLYATFSHFIKLPQYHDHIVSVVRLLLENGANPDAAYIDSQWPDSPLSALYGVAGKFNDPVLTKLLLDSGANPNDNESLYHSVEHGDLTVTHMLLDRGAKVSGSNTLKHMLDYENLDGLRLLLEHDADVNELNPAGENALLWALKRGRSIETIQLILDAGVDINAKRKDGLDSSRYALRLGRLELVEMFKTYGAEDTYSAVDLFLGACWRGDLKAASKLIEEDSELINSLTEHDKSTFVAAASEGNTSGVATMLSFGFDINTRGAHNATALHWAAWFGRAQTVEFLMERGADINIEGADLGSTPLQWALYGTAIGTDASYGSLIQVIKALISSGAQLRDNFMGFASDKCQLEIGEWLEKRAS